MSKKQLLNAIETVSWELECTIGDRSELYNRLDELVFAYEEQFGESFYQGLSEKAS